MKQTYRVTTAGFMLGLWRKEGEPIELTDRQAAEFAGKVERKD